MCLLISWRSGSFGVTWLFVLMALANHNNNSGRKTLTKGRIFHGNNSVWHGPFWSIAVDCSSPAVMPLLRIEQSSLMHAILTIGWFLLLHMPQQRLPMLLSGPDGSKNCPLLLGVLSPVYAWFPRKYVVPTWVSPQPPSSISIGSAICTQFICVTNTQTDTQTTLHVTSVAIGRIYAVPAMQPKNKRKIA